MNAKQRRKQRRASVRYAMRGGSVFASRIPEWAKATPAEIMRNVEELRSKYKALMREPSPFATLFAEPPPLKLDSDHELRPFRYISIGYAPRVVHS